VGEPPAEPILTDEESAALQRGVAQFNDGLYFECHDTLEDMWTGLRGPSRDFFQGLIQVSVAFYHLDNCNLAGADSMLRRALKRFQPYPDRYFGLDLAAHRTLLLAWLARIAEGTLQEPGLERPQWRFDQRNSGAITK
jgi:predicted metal-dependent hydrolase